jgi:hypothetical protein
MRNPVNKFEIVSHVAQLAAVISQQAEDPVKSNDAEQIFISYRREDAGYAGRLYDWLQKSFPKKRIFMDVDAIAAGTDYMQRINKAIDSADVLMVLIGPRWLDAGGGKESRLQDEDDVVRHEISVGLQRNIFILPVLLGRAAMPSHKVLPADLRDFSRRNAIEINDPTWTDDTNHLIDTLQKALAEPEAPKPDEDERLAQMLVSVGNFLKNSDSSYDMGHFLIIGAGKEKQGVPAFGIEIFSNDKISWCELASEVYTWNKAKIRDQISSLEENGWVSPAEGPYTKTFFRGMKLNRWWRNLDDQVLADNFTDVSNAILKTFIEVYRLYPSGMSLGWTSAPDPHPLDRAKPAHS